MRKNARSQSRRGYMTMTERRFPNRLYAGDPDKSYLRFLGVESRLGSRRSVRVADDRHQESRPDKFKV